MTRCISLAFSILLLVSGVLGASSALAGQLDAGQRMKILLRALAYDRGLEGRAAGDKVVVKVLFNAGDGASAAEKDAVLSALQQLSSAKINGLELSADSLSYQGPAALQTGLTSGRVAALYVCAGLKGKLKEITGVTRAAKVATLSGSKAYAETGVAISAIEQAGAGKIIVNLPSAKAEGLKLDAALLRLATVLR